MENHSCFLAISVPSEWVVFKNSANDFPILYLLHGGRFYISRQTTKKKAPRKLFTNLTYVHCWGRFILKLPAMLGTFFSLRDFLARKQNMRLMSVSIEYQSPQDALGSRQRGNHVFSTVIKGNRMCVCVCVCQNWSLLARFAKFDACNQNKYIII